MNIQSMIHGVVCVDCIKNFLLVAWLNFVRRKDVLTLFERKEFVQDTVVFHVHLKGAPTRFKVEDYVLGMVGKMNVVLNCALKMYITLGNAGITGRMEEVEMPCDDI